ncbi:sulfotransferase family protein [Marinicella sp. W31]|uniref:sulfotransferase family protein n=1 Tax=Marinicella sp. W31 TaxID=3023713 RepID=UPI0037573A00
MNSQLRFNLDQFARSIDGQQMDQALRSPVFILSAPRSGSTLLMELLTQHESVWSIGRESHIIYNEFPHLKAENTDLDSGRLTAEHADEETVYYMRLLYYMLIQNHQQTLLYPNAETQLQQPYAFVEKTPRNALNIPFLLKLFPQARFVILHRQPEATLSSLIEAWEVGAESGRFVSFRDLPGWHLPHWCFLLPPGWRDMSGQPLEQIVAFQWRQTYALMMEDLQDISTDRCCYLSFEDVLSDTPKSIEQLNQFMGIPESVELQRVLQQTPQASASTVSAPAANKWHRHKALIEPIMSELGPLYQLLQERSH